MFSWSAFLLYAFVSTITPGPNNIASMAWGMKVGFFKALPFNAGIVTGFCIVMYICCALTMLSMTIPEFMLPIKILGSAYLLWFAWKIYSSAYDPKPVTVDFSKAFISGLLLQFANVKIMIYGIVSLQLFIAPFFKDPVVLFSFATLLALIGSSCNLIWSATGTACASLFRTHTRLINTVLALSMCLCVYTLW